MFSLSEILLICAIALYTAQADNLMEHQEALGGSDRNGDIKFVRELSCDDINSELLEYSADHAILFHAPWCVHCKQLFPYWELIANSLHEKESHIPGTVIGLFDCEVDQDHEDMCTRLMIEQYPTVVFIGSNNMNQASQGAIFPTSVDDRRFASPRVVVYEAELYPHVLYEWIQWLSSISSLLRRLDYFWDGVLTVFSAVGLVGLKGAPKQGRGYAGSAKELRHSARIVELEEATGELESQVQQCDVEVGRFKTLEMFDSLKNHGDVFALLHEETGEDATADAELGPADDYAKSLEMLPLRMCVSDMVTEYCKYKPPKDTTYCALFMHGCVESFLEAEECRPRSCPFQSDRGCAVVSSCILEDVLIHYADAIQDTLFSINGYSDNTADEGAHTDGGGEVGVQSI